MFALKNMELSTPYLIFTLFETVMINGVGFFSLIFQPYLQKTAKKYQEKTGLESWKIDALFGLFWTTTDATSDSIYLLHLIVAGWLGIAGILQAGINFFTNVSFELRLLCLYTFFLCDMFWIAIMIVYSKQFKWTHKWGSVFTILCRLPFVFIPTLITKQDYTIT